MSLTGYAVAHHLTPFISMQNHHSLLYREEEREMLPLLKVSPCHFRARTSNSDCLNVQLRPPAPRRRMYPVESPGERCPHSAVGRDQRARENGSVSIHDHTEKPWSLTASSQLVRKVQGQRVRSDRATVSNVTPVPLLVGRVLIPYQR